MAIRDNKYSMSYELNVEKAAVLATLREKNDSGEFDTIDTREFGVREVAEKLMPNVTLYGLSKVLQDRTSDVKAGPDKLAAMDEVLARLAEGEWEKARVVGAPVVSAEVEALAELKGISIPDAQKALKKYSKEQKEQILANEKIVERAKEIRARRDAQEEDVSLDDLV